MQRIPSIWVCFTTQGVIQNGSVFRPRTHASGHFILESPPPPGVSVTMHYSATLIRYLYIYMSFQRIYVAYSNELQPCLDGIFLKYNYVFYTLSAYVFQKKRVCPFNLNASLEATLPAAAFLNIHISYYFCIPISRSISLFTWFPEISAEKHPPYNVTEPQQTTFLCAPLFPGVGVIICRVPAGYQSLREDGFSSYLRRRWFRAGPAGRRLKESTRMEKEALKCRVCSCIYGGFSERDYRVRYGTRLLNSTRRHGFFLE